MKPSQTLGPSSRSPRSLSSAVAVVERTAPQPTSGRGRAVQSRPAPNERLDSAAGTSPLSRLSTASPPAATSRPRPPAAPPSCRGTDSTTSAPPSATPSSGLAAPSSPAPRARPPAPRRRPSRDSSAAIDIDPVARPQQPYRRAVGDPHRRRHHLDGPPLPYGIVRHARPPDALRRSGPRPAGVPWPRGNSAAAVTASPAATRPPSVPYEPPQLIPPAAHPHGSEVRHLAGTGRVRAQRAREEEGRSDMRTTTCGAGVRLAMPDCGLAPNPAEARGLPTGCGQLAHPKGEFRPPNRAGREATSGSRSHRARAPCLR